MGHLRHLKREYRELVDRLEAGTAALPEPQEQAAWEAWREVLEILYTPEEAALAAKLPVLPSSLAAVARQTGVAEAELRPRLDALCDRGLVMDLVSPTTGETSYFLSPPVVGFFEFSFMRAGDLIPKKRLAEALEAYTHGDPTFAREVFGRGGTTIGRTLVHEEVLDDSAEVLDWERATALVRDAKHHAVSLCYCRHKAEHLGKACGAPVETCLSLDGGAEFVVRRNFGRAVERAEALDILEGARARGLVQIADNVQQRPTYLCNCCGCCCNQLMAINDFGLYGVNPSGFRPVNDAERCAGCSRCARACPIGAIGMSPARQPSQPKSALHPQIDAERCIGCGACAHACHKDALRMERRPNPPHVPLNTIEKSVRLALDRGRLADLLLEAGEGHGWKLLHRLVGAVTRLPPVQRALASEQLQSRFVAVALAGVRDPTV